MYKLIVRTHFDAAHWIDGYGGKCSNLHGHRWTVEVVYLFDDDELGDSKKDPRAVDGMLVDFKSLKGFIEAVVPDHSCLNKIFDWNPTAENIAKYISDLIKCKHESVTVWETPDCGATYVPDQAKFICTTLSMKVLNEQVVNSN